MEFIYQLIDSIIRLIVPALIVLVDISFKLSPCQILFARKKKKKKQKKKKKKNNTHTHTHKENNKQTKKKQKKKKRFN